MRPISVILDILLSYIKDLQPTALLSSDNEQKENHFLDLQGIYGLMSMSSYCN